MLLTITTTHRPATDLGYLLHKNPARPQFEDLPFGRAHVFYPEATDDRCTAALLLEVDPVGLCADTDVAGEGAPLEHYVNDRPYVASSFLSVAIDPVLRQRARRHAARSARSSSSTPLPLEATPRLPSVPRRRGVAPPALRAARLRARSSRASRSTRRSPSGAAARTSRSTLRATTRLRDLLTHLYVLVPVLDDEKHYFVGDDEVAKLLRHGEGWLAAHPRAGAHRQALPPPPADPRRGCSARSSRRSCASAATRSPRSACPGGGPIERPMRLDEQRIGAVAGGLKASGAKRVARPRLRRGQAPARAAAASRRSSEIVGVDVSHPRARARAGPPAARVDARAPARAGDAPARLAHLPRQAARRLRRRRAGRGGRAPRPAAAAGVRARRLRVRPPRHGGRHDAERRVQRALRGAAGRASCGTATTASSGRAPSSRTGRARVAEALRLRRSASSPSGRGRPEVGPPTQMAVFEARPDERRRDELKVPELSLVVLVGASGSGKSTFARKHFKPTEVLSSDFCRGLVADDENDQSATDDAFELLALHRRQAPGRRPADRGRRHERAARGAPAAGRARPRASLPAGRDRARPARDGSATSATRAAPDRDFGAARGPPAAASSCGGRCKGLHREGFRHVFVLDSPEEIDAADDRARSRSGTTGGTSTARSTSSATSTAASTSSRRCSTSSATTSSRTTAEHASTLRHPRGPQGGLRRRPRRPRPDTSRACCGWSWPWSAPGRAVRARQPRDQADAQAPGRDVQITHGLAETLAQLEREPPDVPRARWSASSTAWSATTCSTTASWSSPTPA